MKLYNSMFFVKNIEKELYYNCEIVHLHGF